MRRTWVIGAVSCVSVIIYVRSFHFCSGLIKLLCILLSVILTLPLSLPQCYLEMVSCALCVKTIL